MSPAPLTYAHTASGHGATGGPPVHVPQAGAVVRGATGGGGVSWLVSLPALDGRDYVYRVHAPLDALPADLFWAAFHCHDDGPHPRASDRFDAAQIRRAGPERAAQN